MKKTIAALAVAAEGSAMTLAAPASAAIQCKDEFQWIKGTG